MKKSILMAIVALALLAAPAFAGDYGIVGNIDFGWGFGLNADGADYDLSTPGVLDGGGIGNLPYTATNDFTMLGFFGSVDANNSLAITLEYGASGGAEWGGTNLINQGNADIFVTGFDLTTNVLGAFGVTDVPVTVFMTSGFNRINLHNRFQQWTGFEIKRWKNNGAAHLENAWNRYAMFSLTVGIMNMVNVRAAFSPMFGSSVNNSEGDAVTDFPILMEVWTSGITAGPAALDISANLRAQGQEMRFGGQVTANMNFGALSLLAFVGDDYYIQNASGAADNAIYVAVKPSYNFGAGSVALGAWVGITSYNEWENAAGVVQREDGYTTIDFAVDLAVSFSTLTIYGGVQMHDVTDEVDNVEYAGDELYSIPMIYDIGVKNSFGAATVALGYAYNELGTGYDIGAADGTSAPWVSIDEDDGTPTFVGGVYFRVSAWY